MLPGDEELDLPAAVIEALAHYRRLAEERGWDWGGEDLPDLFRWARFSRIGDVMTAAAVSGDWARAARDVVDAAGGDAGVLRVVVDGPPPDGARPIVTVDGVHANAMHRPYLSVAFVTMWPGTAAGSEAVTVSSGPRST